MKIRHERPMSDLSFQVRAPLTLELTTGERLLIEEWSLSGFQYPGTSDILPRQGVLSIPFQGVDIRFDVALAPGSEPRSLQFVDLSGRQRETLAVFYRSILSGKMASTDNVITSLDTPVDLVPMGEKEEETAAATAGKTPRSYRVVWNALFYAIFAVVVFGVIGSSIYDRLSGIRLQHGRVMAPFIEHRISEAAFVDDILVAVGDNVRAGDVLVVLNSPERDGALDAVRIDIRLAERRQAEAQRRLDQVRTRRAAYQANLQADLDRALGARTIRDFLGGYNMSDVQAATAALSAFQDLTDPLALEFREIEAQLTEVLEERGTDLRQLKRDLSNAKDSYDAINLVAQVDGTVRDLPLVEDLHQTRGTLGAVIEEHSPRQVVGWISERASQDLFVGQDARLRVATPDGSRSLDAKIVDVTAGVDPARPTEFGVVVTLQTQQTDLDQNRAELRPNAPVEIRADRGWVLTPIVLAFRAWWT